MSLRNRILIIRRKAISMLLVSNDPHLSAICISMRLSPQSFSEALRRAFPPLPKIFLYDQEITVKSISRSRLLLPTVRSSKTYHTWSDLTPIFNDFIKKHNCTVPFFTTCQPSSRANGSNALLDFFETPKLSARLARAEHRVNLMDFPRTSILQSELQRTETEFRQLCDLARAANAQAEGQNPNLYNFEQTGLQLLWDSKGWFLEEPAVAVQQSKRVPPPAGGYGSAWIRPMCASLTDFAGFALSATQVFCVEDDITFLPIDMMGQFLSNGGSMPYLGIRFNKRADYWAATGDPVAFSEADTEHEMRLKCRYSPLDTCWFAAAELSSRQLQLRHDRQMLSLPVTYDGCGFFLHEAPWWFTAVTSYEELLQSYPISAETVKNLPFVSECGALCDVVAEATGGHAVLVLREGGEWEAYPRERGTVNFFHTIPKPLSEMGPLVFLEINFVFEIMRQWAKRQSQSLDGICDAKMSQLISLFSSSQEDSMQCAATFIELFIKYCAFDVNSDDLKREEVYANVVVSSETIREHAKEAVETQSSTSYALPTDLHPMHESMTEWRNRAFSFCDNDDEDDDTASDSKMDFPAVDRRVYSQAHRISQAYTHPHNQLDANKIPPAPHLPTELIKGITEATQKTALRKSQTELTEFNVLTEGNEKHVFKDTGIIIVSFAYSIPAANAFDLEVATL